jgi:cyclophilin family peptidyl-prolyl cis-trans isomerase
VPTEKRQRQKAGRQARLAAEQKTQKRKRSLRRVITVVIVAGVVFGISYAIFGNSSKSKNADATTTTTKPTSTTTTTTPAPAGGSGNTSLAAVTTSADCPSNLKATLNKPSWKTAPPMTIDTSKTYTATVTTDVGPFTIQLDAKGAPKSVNNFVFLAEHHFYDCVIFHRVIQTFMDQTGDPTGTGTGGPGYQYTEAGPKIASPQYPIGSVAMANSNSPATTDPSTNGSQFFIVTGPEGEDLSPDYTLFGKVTSGMSVLDKINAGGSTSSSETGTPVTLHRMISVTISES